MRNILIINAHHKYPFSEGKLNQTLVEIADTTLSDLGHNTRLVSIDGGWNIEEQILHHQRADVVLLQSPVNWMGVPWSFKKYMDEVYSAGMQGQLCDGDGRHRDAPEKQYGSGGTLNGKHYMLSLTFNAPETAFNNPEQLLFGGRSVDDLFFPMHVNFRFFGMEALPTFACFDVIKNADIDNNLAAFRKHLSATIPA